MIEKEIICDFPSNPNPSMQLMDPSVMTKTASYDQEVVDAIEALEKKVDHIYVLVNALSSGEAFGANRNGDFFPEKELMEHHKTYETLGFQYRGHDNKNPEKSFGRVVFSHYNPAMKRVEIIVELPTNKNKDIVDRINRGDYPKTSMGCRVPYDICSICGNKARTRKEYCSHLLMYMGKVMADGRQVYAINVRPKFFDNSWVDRPAAPTAGVLAKVASVDDAKEADEKEAVINKEVVTEITGMDEDPNNLIISSQADIPKEILEKLSNYNDEDLVGTLSFLRIVPKPEEFEQLKIADVAEHCKTPNVKVASELRNLLSELVLTKPRIVPRLNKIAQVTVGDVSDKYLEFIDRFNNVTTGTLLKQASENPWLVEVWTGAQIGGLDHQKMFMKKSSTLENLFIDVPASYVTPGRKLVTGHTPELQKTAGRLSSESLFLNLSSDSLNNIYNSLLYWEEQ
jgi:hypothetical protein